MGRDCRFTDDEKKLDENWWQYYPDSLLERFKKFHSENPQVFKKIREMAIKMRSTGRSKYSIETIINVIRWHEDIKSQGDVFKINNDFKSIYVRLLIHQDPSFTGFFELRNTRSRGIKSDEQRQREQYTQ